jgi:F-type H+-transporting ATPase subunit epsilon
LKIYQFEILTPRGRFFSGEVVHSLVPAEDGFVGVLANHTAYLTSSPGGRLEMRLASGETRSVRVGPGFFQIAKNQAFLVTQSAETGVLLTAPNA